MDLDNLVVEIGACRAADASSRTTNLDPCHAERLAERTRIAQELHDTLLQGLFGVSLRLRAVVDSLSLNETEKFIRPREAMDRVIEEGRRAVLGLRSSYEQYPSPQVMPLPAFLAIWAFLPQRDFEWLWKAKSAN